MRSALAVVVVSLISLVAPDVARSQTRQSENTLKLDRKANMPRAKINDVSWLEGRWVGEGLGGTTEEIWSPPVGNSMMGAFRVVRDGKVYFHELCTIVEENDSLVLKLKHFDAQLKGWEAKDAALIFPLAKLTATEAFFDGLTFRKHNDDSLTAYVVIENKQTGKSREVAFPYRRAAENKKREGG